MRAADRRAVRTRAAGRCEYCRLPEAASGLAFSIDHIVAKQHRGLSTPDNLALACLSRNRHKGPNLTGVDPVTNHTVPLFHPRVHRWQDHFRWRGPVLEGTTDIGRATVLLLAINSPVQIATRLAVAD
jgi:5-methylcytosine-specific restriction endonuclease McrA